MAGPSAFQRQHSSTAACSAVVEIERRKLRRWSSADEPYQLESIPDGSPKYDEKSLLARNQTPSDFDSGVEDLDQPSGNGFRPQSNDGDEDEPIASFIACQDDKEKEHPIPVAPEQPIDPQEECLRRGERDRKCYTRGFFFVRWR